MSTFQNESISAHRLFLLQALERIEQGEFANNVMKDLPSELQESYGLCQEILLGCQRWKGSLEQMISTNVRKRPKHWVRRLLRLALYELYFLKTPPHAVIDQAVQICKESKFHAQSKFVNAFLRQIELPQGVYANQNFPDWLLDLWRQNGQWLKSLQLHPSVGLVLKDDGIISKYTDVIETLCTVDKTLVPNTFYSNQHGPINRWKGYEAGDWWVMNPAAVQVVDITYAHLSSENPSVLDVCAAPGGKSFRFHSLGAKVTALDISEHRLKRFQENCTRLNMEIPSFQQDATEWNESLGQFDAVFLDAPCSGLGVIRKHPEIRWNRTESDVKANSILQRQILLTASKYVKKGGILAYCVCSLHPFEGQQVVDDFLMQHPDWVQVESWSTPIDSKQIQQEKLDGFQLYILEAKV